MEFQYIQVETTLKHTIKVCGTTENVQVSTPQTADGVYCGIQMKRTIEVCGTTENVQASTQTADAVHAAV